MNSTITFFKEAVKNFRTHGSILPSSSFLANRMARLVKRKNGMIIVELGAGTGVITKSLLQVLPEKCKLIVVELNPVLAEILQDTILDERVEIICGDALELKKYLHDIGATSADCIISGLPLGDFSKKERQAILQSISSCLISGGQFIQFQYLLASYSHIKKVFKTKIAAYEVRNFPPAFIYECKKV